MRRVIACGGITFISWYQTMKTANSGAIIMITVMALLLIELDVSSRLMLVLMTS